MTSQTLQTWTGAKTQCTSLVVVFTDIVGSSRLCFGMGNERWTEILILHFAQAREVMRGFDCREVKIIGDSFMVVFRTALDALNFVLSFQKDTGHPKVKIRAGIHAGTARIIENDIYGTMVNYAASVVAWIGDDAIALSNAAKEQVDDEFGNRVSELLFVRHTARFKGYEKQQRVWRVDPGIWWRMRDRQALPDVRADEMVASNRYQVVPASDTDVEWIAQLEKEAYSEDDAVPHSVLSEWFNANPDGFSVIQTHDGQRIGHIDILPVRPEALRRLTKGVILERDIRGQELYGSAEKNSIRDLYVESIIIRPAKGLSSSPAILYVLSTFATLVERICPPSQIGFVYAIAASQSGARLMQQIGFKVEPGSNDRVDGHDLFSTSFRDLVVNLQSLLGQKASPLDLDAVADDGL